MTLRQLLTQSGPVTSSRLVDHLLSCVVNYDGRLEILKLRLTSEGGLNSLLKFRSMPQLRSLDAFPIVDGTARRDVSSNKKVLRIRSGLARQPGTERRYFAIASSRLIPSGR